MTDKKLKILFLVNDLMLGGGQTVLFNILKYINHDRFKPVVVSIFPPNYYSNKIRNLGVRVHYLNLKFTGQFLIAALKLFFIIKKEKPDIINTHLFESDILGRIIGRLAGVRIIFCTIHSKITRFGYLYWLDRATKFLVTKYIAISKYIADFTQEKIKVDDSRVEIINNGIEIKKFSVFIPNRQKLIEELKIKPSVVLISCVAGLRKAKGHQYLFYALKEVIKKYDNIKLILAGEGELEKDLKDLSLKLGLGKHIYFLGNRDDVPNIIKCSDLFIFPSLFEGFGLALVEALACGAAIIASDLPEFKLILKNNYSALLVPPANYKALAEKIIELLENQNLKKILSENALRQSQYFDVRKMVNKYEELFLNFS